jgi:S-adenosylmethionine synthetase
VQGTSSSKQSGQIMRAVSALVRKVFPLSPKGMIDHLGLRKPISGKTAVFGHFGRPEFSWEKPDAVEELLAKANSNNMKLLV